MCVSYLFYGGDSDDKEEGQAAGDWAGGGVDDKLQGEGKKNSGRNMCGGGTCGGETAERRGERMPSNATLSKEFQQGKASVIRNQAPIS